MRKVYSKHSSVSFLGKRILPIRACQLGAEGIRLNFGSILDVIDKKDGAYIAKSLFTGKICTNCKFDTDSRTDARFRFAYKNEYKLRAF